MVKREINKANKNITKKQKKEEVKKVEEEEDSVSEEVESIQSEEEEIEVEENERESNKNSRMRDIKKTLDALETNEKNTGVIYIGHLPWGFEDKGIKKYFEQFGTITRIIVPKSKKVN